MKFKYYVTTGAILGMLVTPFIPGKYFSNDIFTVLYYCLPVMLGAIFGAVIESVVKYVVYAK